MLGKPRVIFIGGGNLATAIFSQLDANAYKIIVIQRNLDKLNILKDKYPHIEFYTTVEFNFNTNDVLIMAVKPQDALNTCSALTCRQLNLPIIVSVMAGITTAILAKMTNNTRIVRTMPNILSSVGFGATGIFFTPIISNGEQELISTIFNSVGQNYIVNDEDKINKISVVTGSSPAYLYYFIECMIDSATKLGFAKEQAIAMTKQVVRGSIELIQNNPQQTLAELRQSITSKKGTTAAAIKVLEEANLSHILLNAELAAIKRAEELALGVNGDD